MTRSVPSSDSSFAVVVRSAHALQAQLLACKVARILKDVPLAPEAVQTRRAVRGRHLDGLRVTGAMADQPSVAAMHVSGAGRGSHLAP